MRIWTYILAAIFALTALFVYFIPTMIAMKNAHPRRWLLFAVNLLLGVTVFGWIACMLWATAKRPAAER